MKKGLMVLSLGLACGLVAYGATISLPLVADDGSAAVAANNYSPATGTATFITVKNNTGSAQTCSVAMTDYAGADVTPAANTFVVGAGASVGIRPVANDAAAESPGLAGMNATGPPLGSVVSVTLTCPGAPAQWASRVAVLNNTASYGYTSIPY